jgi:hypothetical protein
VHFPISVPANMLVPISPMKLTLTVHGVLKPLATVTVTIGPGEITRARLLVVLKRSNVFVILPEECALCML